MYVYTCMYHCVILNTIFDLLLYTLVCSITKSYVCIKLIS